MKPYSVKYVTMLHLVSMDFCSLSFPIKYQLGLSLDLLEIGDVNLSEKDLEIKIWRLISKNDLINDFVVEVDMYKCGGY